MCHYTYRKWSLLFAFVEFNGGSAKAVATTVVTLLVLFFFCRISLCSFILPSPTGLCGNIFPCPRVVSSVQQLSFLLHHVRCCPCSLSDLLASHYSEIRSAFLWQFALFGLLSAFYSSCSCCSARPTMSSSPARMLFLLQPFWSSCITFFKPSVSFCFRPFRSFFLMVLVLLVLCSRTRYASISLTLP